MADELLAIAAAIFWLVFLGGLPLWYVGATLARWRKELAEFRQQRRDGRAIRNGFLIRDAYPPKLE